MEGTKIVAVSGAAVLWLVSAILAGSSPAMTILGMTTGRGRGFCNIGGTGEFIASVPKTHNQYRE